MKRKICVVTGSRAEYGLLRPLLKEINDDLKFTYNFPDEEFVTVGGFVCHLFGKIPATGEIIKHSGLSIEILEADKRKVIRTKIKEEKSQLSSSSENEDK